MFAIALLSTFLAMPSSAQENGDAFYTVRICGEFTTKQDDLYLVARLNGAEKEILIKPFRPPTMSGPGGEYPPEVDHKIKIAQVFNLVQLGGRVVGCAFSDRLPVGEPLSFYVEDLTKRVVQEKTK